jgi:hypothetical protein
MWWFVASWLRVGTESSDRRRRMIDTMSSSLMSRYCPHANEALPSAIFASHETARSPSVRRCPRACGPQEGDEREDLDEVALHVRRVVTSLRAVIGLSIVCQLNRRVSRKRFGTDCRVVSSTNASQMMSRPTRGLTSQDRERGRTKTLTRWWAQDEGLGIERRGNHASDGDREGKHGVGSGPDAEPAAPGGDGDVQRW